MKFNDLTIRELRAQATAACLAVVAQLPEEKKAKYDFLTVDLIKPMENTAVDEEDDFEYFTVLGVVRLTDKTKLSFKADLAWCGDYCGLSDYSDSVEFIDVDVDGLTTFY